MFGAVVDLFFFRKKLKNKERLNYVNMKYNYYFIFIYIYIYIYSEFCRLVERFKNHTKDRQKRALSALPSSLPGSSLVSHVLGCCWWLVVTSGKFFSDVHGWDHFYYFLAGTHFRLLSFSFLFLLCNYGGADAQLWAVVE